MPIIEKLLPVTVIALLAAPMAQAAQLVVVESTSPSLPAGTVVDGAQALPLAAGDRVALVREDGTLVRLTGPSSTAPGSGDASPAGDKGVVQSLSRLFAANQPSASAWGTFRGNEPLPGRDASNPPGVWVVNVVRSDSICVPAATEPTLWRSDAQREQVVVLLHLSTGREADVEFAAGQAEATWPKSVPLLDGGEYALRDSANLWERRLAVRVIPAEEAGAVRQIAWMSDAGCIRQARALLAGLKE